VRRRQQRVNRWVCSKWLKSGTKIFVGWVEEVCRSRCHYPVVRERGEDGQLNVNIDAYLLYSDDV